jgi:hypothetical protein
MKGELNEQGKRPWYGDEIVVVPATAAPAART